jgi:hypothetical protein
MGRAGRLRLTPEIEPSRKGQYMPDREQERKAREAHIEKIEGDTRKERAKADERSGVDKQAEKQSDPAPTRPPGRGSFRRSAERMANAADHKERLSVSVAISVQADKSL